MCDCSDKENKSVEHGCLSGYLSLKYFKYLNFSVQAKAEAEPTGKIDWGGGKTEYDSEYRFCVHVLVWQIRSFCFSPDYS